MNIHPEDPRLTSYLLGETTPEEDAVIDQAVRQDPAVRTSLQESQDFANWLAEGLARPPESLAPEQRSAILQAARANTSSPSNSVPFPGQASAARKLPVVPISIAAALILGLLLLPGLLRKNVAPATATADPAPATQPQSPLATAPISPSAPVPAAPSTPLATTPEPPTPAAPVAQLTAESRTPATTRSLPLPILQGQTQIDSLVQTVRIDQRLPPPINVRLEEILNHFPLRLSGVTAIARAARENWHPDQRELGATIHTATLATETLPCPWKPSATLLLISIRGNATQDCEVTASFTPNPATVSLYRLLGFTPTTTTAAPPAGPTKLRAGTNTTLAIEVESIAATGDLGTINWTINDQPAPLVTIGRTATTEPSDDARFAALTCAYAQWLTHERATIDGPLLAALTRECISDSLSPERADFLNLILQSLDLEIR